MAKHASRELLHYKHYHDRYKAHTDSYKLEAKLKQTVQQKITNLKDRQSTSKHILLYSYPFAYYMFGEELFCIEKTEQEREIKKNLFEDQQQQLEANVEKLSMCLKEPFHTFEDAKVEEVRMRVIPMTSIVDTLCKKLYDRIQSDLLGSLLHTTQS